MTLFKPPPQYRAVHDVVTDVLSATSSPQTVHEVVDAGTGLNPDVDREFGQLGFFGMDVPASHGGGDSDVRHLRYVAEACGRSAASSRILGTTGLCIGALLMAGSHQQQARWLPQLAEGRLNGTAALPGLFSRIVSTDELTARRADGGWLLAGVAAHVIDAVGAGLLVVLCRTDQGSQLLGLLELPADGVTIEHQPTVDRTRSLGLVRLESASLAREHVLAEGPTVEPCLNGLVDRAAVLLAADAVGSARRVVDLTASYAKQREQFDRPIGSFQAVKHQAADMLVKTELAHVLVEDAAAALDEARADASVTASMAKEMACATAAWVAGRGVQLHGGIGYTWEHEMHIHLKRAKLDEALLGDRQWHRERIARMSAGSADRDADSYPVG